MAAPPAPRPKTLLGYHRILSPSAGVRVSPLCLGTMCFGEAWSRMLGECSKETSFEILDKFYESGGNFLDTANAYQNEDSEKWVGEWIQARNNRDELVLATKYTLGYSQLDPRTRIKANFQGNHAKSMRHSVEASLKKLQTSYIDILYVHHWDFTTSVEELMIELNRLVDSGKVIYLGISDTPAWLVVKCNDYAREKGLTRFSIYQGHWSAAFRDFERDILPMCLHEGLALAPWGALGRGQFRTAEEYASDAGRKNPQYEGHRLVGEKLATLAQKKNTLPTSIAQAYVMHKAPYVFPVVGTRKVAQLEANIEALGVELTEEEMEEIEGAVPFDIGFPMSFLYETPKQKYKTTMRSEDIWQLSCNTRLETVPNQRPIGARQGERRID